MTTLRTFIYIGTILSLFLSGVMYSRAYVASSTNYRLERDSINIGGALSSSTSYSEEDTVGEVGTGYSSSTSYMIHAGYQQLASTTLSISNPADVALTPDINSQTGGTGDGSALWTVTTNSSSGYTLSISASTNPALSSGSDTFANYTPTGVNPDYVWSISSSASEFGFSPEGSDIVSRYKDNGSNCAVGVLDTASACWDPVTTANTTVASRASAAISGATTTIRFRAEAGSSRNQSTGTYQAVITVTAVAI